MVFASIGYRYLKYQIRPSYLTFRKLNLHSQGNITPLKRYSQMLKEGILKPDKQQFSAILKFQEIFNELKEFSYPIIEDDKMSVNPTAKGLYLHGGVGTGKTLLLDIFYDCMPTQHKKRVHFNAFMLYLYSEMNRWNLCCEDDVHLISPTEHIANKIMQDAWLLCFDEIQLADYASCTMLVGVLSHMISKGAVIVGTSNRAPLELGDSSITENFDGETTSVQKSLTSFKSMFVDKCHVHYLESERDHRTEMTEGEPRYLYPMSNENEEKFDWLFANSVPSGQGISSSTVEIYGRKILVPLSASHVARFSFKELCCHPLGPADFIKICNTFKVIFIDHIPKMNINQKNEARRLLSFIDAAYECRVKVYCTAEALPENLFLLLPRNDGEYNPDQMHMEMIGEIAYDLKIHGMDFKSLNIISGEDEIFSFKRAISRLKEMQSKFYQTTDHRPQTFLPYVGTANERDRAEDRRRDREKQRQQLIQEQTVDDKNLHESFKQDNFKREFNETDWGDEASYITVSKEASKRLNNTKRTNSDTQVSAPKFGEQHFWGFGWWEHVKNKIKRPKDPTK